MFVNVILKSGQILPIWVQVTQDRKEQQKIFVPILQRRILVRLKYNPFCQWQSNKSNLLKTCNGRVQEWIKIWYRMNPEVICILMNYECYEFGKPATNATRFTEECKYYNECGNFFENIVDHTLLSQGCGSKILKIMQTSLRLCGFFSVKENSDVLTVIVMPLVDLSWSSGNAINFFRKLTSEKKVNLLEGLGELQHIQLIVLFPVFLLFF